jgi:hypothetical protein
MKKMLVALRSIKCKRVMLPVLAILAGCGQLAFAQYADIRAARIDEIAAILPDMPQALAPPCKDRAAWGPLAGRLGPEIDKAAGLLGKPFPAWSDDDYLDYFKSGSRERGQAMLNARQAWLEPLLLAECAEWKGRFLPALSMVLNELATQKSWALPAHDVDQGYISSKRYFVELNSAQMGYVLATSLALLGDRLPPETRILVMQSLEKRMFAPMRASYASGKGQTWLHVESNWNAVCLAGVTGAALAVLQDKHDRAMFLAAAEYYQQFYKNSFPDDGFEVEGIGYWNYGFSSYASLREELWQATKGKVDLFNDAKMQKAARFGQDIQMLPGVIAYFSDAHFGSQPDPQLLAYIDRIFNLEDVSPQIIEHPKGPISFQLIQFFPSRSGVSGSAADLSSSPLRTFYPAAGVLVARPRDAKGMAFTIKAGGDGPHNHNDIGSYAIGLGTAQPLGEPGGPAFYTSQTFSRDRFLSKLLNSYGHLVPVVDGGLQRNSLQVKAPVDSIHFTNDEDSMTIDMTNAYDATSLKRLLRHVTYSRLGKGAVDIVDSYDVEGTIPVEDAITTHGQWKQVDASTLDFTMDGETVRVSVIAPAGLTITSEKINEYGNPFTRVALRVKIRSGEKIALHLEPLARQN